MTHTNPEDSDGDRLLTRYQNGDDKALREIVRLLHPKLEKTIHFATGDRTAIEDLVQECWHAIIPQLSTLDVNVSLQAWALSIARRKSVDWIRARQRQREKRIEMREESSIREETTDNETGTGKLERVYAGIETLPASQKIVLELFYLENLTLKEISKLLSISEGTVKSRLFTAREYLKQTIT